MADANNKIQFYSGTYPRRSGRRPITFCVKEPVMLDIDDREEGITATSGCCIVDILFPEPTFVGELVFRNWYTASVDILVKTKDDTDITDDSSCGSSAGDDGRNPTDRWVVSVPHYVLMPHPHLDSGSQDVFSITAVDSKCSWGNLSAIRLILRQPSPCWYTFYVSEVSLFHDSPVGPPRTLRHEHPIGTPPCQDFSSLLALVRQQTIDTLKNTPRKKQFSGVPYDPDAPKYEFFHLPKV